MKWRRRLGTGVFRATRAQPQPANREVSLGSAKVLATAANFRHNRALLSGV